VAECGRVIVGAVTPGAEFANVRHGSSPSQPQLQVPSRVRHGAGYDRAYAPFRELPVDLVLELERAFHLGGLHGVLA
jgi:hypothetical protein